MGKDKGKIISNHLKGKGKHYDAKERVINKMTTLGQYKPDARLKKDKTANHLHNLGIHCNINKIDVRRPKFAYEAEKNRIGSIHEKNMPAFDHLEKYTNIAFSISISLKWLIKISPSIQQEVDKSNLVHEHEKISHETNMSANVEQHEKIYNEEDITKNFLCPNNPKSMLAVEGTRNDETKLSENSNVKDPSNDKSELPENTMYGVANTFMQWRNINMKHPTIQIYMIPDVKSHPKAIEDIPWPWLREEKWRLHTFAKYPHNTAKSALLLAADGFSYIGTGKGCDDSVTCFFCCATKKHWQSSDVIPEVHKSLSPQCPMITGIGCNNIPMTTPSIGSSLFNQLYHMNGNKPRGLDNDEIQTDASPLPSQAQQQRPATSQNRETGKSVQMAVPSAIGTGVPATTASNQVNSSTITSYQPSSNDAPSTTVASGNRHGEASLHHGAAERSQSLMQQEGRANGPSYTATSQAASQNRQQNLPDSNATTASNVTNSQSATLTSSASRTPVSTASTPTPAAQNNGISSQDQTQGTARPVTPNSSSNSTASANGSQATNNTTAQSSTGTSQNSRRPPTYSDLGIITERPKRFEYAVRESRLNTFEAWPRDHHLKKEDLADAGFYFAGYGDCARCFYCGGGLRNWEDEDNVWIEHARWFPKCAFIRQQMGQAFVDAVQALNESHDKIDFTLIRQKLGESAANSFQLGVREEPMKRDPAVLTVMDMGYEEKDVLEAAKYIKETESILSADKIFEKLVRDEKCRTVKQGVTDPLDVGKTSNTAQDKEIMKSLKEQNNQLRQQTVCKICMDKEVAVVFLPCGHLVSCTDCASAMKDCPVCRNTVKGIVRAFMS